MSLRSRWEGLRLDAMEDALDGRVPVVRVVKHGVPEARGVEDQIIEDLRASAGRRPSTAPPSPR